MKYKYLITYILALLLNFSHAQYWTPVASLNNNINDIVYYDQGIWIGGESVCAKWNNNSFTTYFVPGVIKQMSAESSIMYAAGDLYFDSKPQLAQWDYFLEEWNDLENLNETTTAVYEDGSNLYVATSSGLTYASTMLPITFDTMAAPFTTNGSAAGKVLCFIIYRDTLYAAGSFRYANGTPTGPIARWNGQFWEKVPAMVNITGTINCMAKYNGELFIGGKFFLSNGSAFDLARWNGNTWLPVSSDLNTGLQGVQDMLSIADGLYIVGDFTIGGTTTTKNAARWNGTNLQSLGYDVPTGYLSCITSMPDNSYPFNAIYAASKAESSDNHLYRLNYTPNGINDIEKNKLIEIYPNPVNDILHINLNRSDVQDIYITDITGRKVIELDFAQTIDVSNLHKGLYYFTITSKSTTFVAKFLKK